jgi:aminopeptidase N
MFRNLRSRWMWGAGVALVTCLVALGADAQDRRGPFTAPPRSVRTRDIDQQHIRLDLRFDWEQQQIDGVATLRLRTFRPLREIVLDAAEMQIRSAALRPLKGPPVELKHETRGQELRLALDREYPAESELTVIVEYRIVRPKRGAHFVVADEREPDKTPMVWTQSEPEFARYWYPCFDSPNDRLTSEIVATVPQGMVTLSNGVLQERRDNADGTRTWHWVQAKSHVPYLLSIVAGDFEAFEQRWNDLPVVSYVPRGRLEEAPRSFEKTPRMVQYFSEKIGVAYPWEKYAQICVDEYHWGGMEHTSATTLTLRTLHDARAHLDVSSDNLVAHELAHQWWGDLVTCKDWGELWLNESFATYFATLWTEHDWGWDEAVWARRDEANSYFQEDRRYRRPIVTYRYPRPDAMFDRHTYPKGGRVLHALRFVLGEEAFWRAIRRYAEVNQHRTVETADLRRAIEESTGQGLNWFFDQWAHHGGHPEFDVAWRWDDNAGSVALTVKQTQKVDDLTPLFRTPVEIEIGHGTEAQTRRIEVSKGEETFHFALDARPSRVVFDPRDWVLKKLVSRKSKEEWLDQLAHCTHVMGRAEAVEGLKEFQDHPDALAALVHAARHDPFWGVRQEAVKALAESKGDTTREALLAAAREDEKSFVRREALAALGKFAHDDVRAALRGAIANDRSYYAVAEGLKALVKIDRERCEEALLQALEVSSHGEVVLRAACEGLVELKSSAGAEALTGKLAQPLRPDERVVVIGALARLKGDDERYVELLRGELDHGRASVRRAAVDGLVALGDPRGIAWLQEKRDGEESTGARRALDEAIEKLRDGEKSIARTRQEIEQLRDQNRRLEERLRRLEGERKGEE